ncbi:MAG: TonB-dependent receptor [Pseudomonadota bacterium]
MSLCFSERSARPSALLLCLAVIVPAHAQDAQEGDGLDEIVVTATRVETSMRDLTRSVSIIDKDRIQRGTQQLALDEALAGVPGLYLQNRYNFAQDLRVALRGFGARSAFGIRGVKVIVDGIPETLPDGQAGVDSIDLGSTERIEVLRGPSSSLYGNASGGVIAIETERAGDDPFVEGSIAAGELGYQKYQLKVGGQADRWDYLVNVSSQELDGYRDHSFSEGRLLNTKVGVQLTDRDRLTIAFNHTDQPTADDPGGINAAQAMADRRSARDRNVLFDTGEALDQQRIGFVYQRDGSAGDLTVRNYYVWRDFSNKLPFVGGGSVDLDRFFYGVGLQYSLDDILPEAWSLTVGLDVDRQDDDRRRFENNEGTLGALTFDQNERVDANGFFAQSSYRISDRLALSAGLRYDEITFDVRDNFLGDGNDSGKVSFDNVSPSLGISIGVGEGVLFANYSNSFETPTTTELANPDGSGGFNRSLDPQEADNFEIGYRLAVSGVSLELAAFNIDLEDELIPFELAQFPGRTFFGNAGRSEREGIEAAASWRSQFGFGVEASFTWSDFAFENFVDDNGNDFSGNELPGLPQEFGYLALTYQHDSGFDARLETSYSGALFANNANSVEVDSYTVSSLRVSHEFDLGDWLLRPFFGINNIFDERYNSNIRINAFGARFFEPAPERNTYAGISVRFGR